VATTPFTRFDALALDLGRKIHDFSADNLRFALTNTAPSKSANAILTDITEIAGGFGYTAGGVTIPITSWSQSGGLADLVCANVTITATGGNIGPWRWCVVFNNTPTNKNLIGFGDYGSSITIADGEQHLFEFNQLGRLLRINVNAA
jgi:hypothetical protein